MKTIALNGHEYRIPESYRQVDPELEAHESSTFITSKTNRSNCTVLASPIRSNGISSLSQANLINLACKTIDNDMGVVEVNSGVAGQAKFAYFILKDPMSDDTTPLGIRYILLMDISTNPEAMRFHGWFEESGVTGTREAIVRELCTHGSNALEAQDCWITDPYGLGFANGVPTNRAEDPKFDELFPEHPLSKARDFVRFVLKHCE